MGCCQSNEKAPPAETISWGDVAPAAPGLVEHRTTDLKDSDRAFTDLKHVTRTADRIGDSLSPSKTALHAPAQSASSLKVEVSELKSQVLQLQDDPEVDQVENLEKDVSICDFWVN